MKTSLVFAQSVTKIAVFDSRKNHEHSKNVIKILKSELKNCKINQVVLFPIFDEDGRFQQDKFISQLKDLDPSFELIHISWNTELTDSHKPLVQQLNRLILEGRTIIAASGQTQSESQLGLTIEKTVMGQVEGIILVGELDQKGKLPLGAYYGEKILAAIPMIKNLPGSSFTSAFVTGRIAQQHCQGQQINWYQRFKQTKTTAQKQWPELKDYFEVKK